MVEGRHISSGSCERATALLTDDANTPSTSSYAWQDAGAATATRPIEVSPSFAPLKKQLETFGDRKAAADTFDKMVRSKLDDILQLKSLLDNVA